VALEPKAVCLGLIVDARVEFGVNELDDRAALPANQVMVVLAGRRLVAHASIAERHAANEVEFLEQLHGAEDGGAAD
jgi:hypothetical protein